MTARILISCGIACLLTGSIAGCSLPLRTGSTATRASTETRFAVLPLNSLVPIATELSGVSDRVLGTLTGYLGAHGHKRRIVEPDRTKQLWRESIIEIQSSETEPKNFRSAIRVFARRLGESTAFDALVVPSLVYRQGKLYKRYVKWDGVVRRLTHERDESIRGDDPSMVPESFRGTVSGVSLQLMVFDSKGALVFENFGGLGLAHTFIQIRGETDRLAAKPLEKFLESESQLNEGVALAFEPYLPRLATENW